MLVLIGCILSISQNGTTQIVSGDAKIWITKSIALLFIIGSCLWLYAHQGPRGEGSFRIILIGLVTHGHDVVILKQGFFAKFKLFCFCEFAYIIEEQSGSTGSRG